jgi:hypothetical protein
VLDIFKEYLFDDDEVLAQLEKHQESTRMCHCYLCRSCRAILAARGLTDDNDLDRNNSKNPSLQADRDSGDI